MKFPFVTYHKYALAKDIFDKATERRVSDYAEAQKPNTIGLVALSKRWGIADLNDVKRIADRVLRVDDGLGFMFWLDYRATTFSHIEDYLLSSVTDYESAVHQKVVNKAIAADLATLKKADAKAKK